MKELQIDKLLGFTKSEFDRFKDKRADNSQYDLGDVLQSGLAMFCLKDSSLLEFNKQFSRREENLKNIYKIKDCPTDGQMRGILDQVAPIQIERVKRSVIQKVKQHGLLETFEFFKGWKLLLIDGVQHFSSHKVSCQNCQQACHDNGSITYSHSMLAAVIAHPDKTEVLPLVEEPIVLQDGTTKNDCELNAAHRLFTKIETQYLDDKFIIVQDALYANGPNIKKIQAKGNRFIIRLKAGSGAGSVLEQFEALKNANPVEVQAAYQSHQLYKRFGVIKPMPQAPTIQKLEQTEKGVIKSWHYVNGLYLNETHKDIKVNFLQYEEISAKDGKVLKIFQWITDITLEESNVKQVAIAGRCRWKIENETFNTLKNQGYHFEHNFGHGQKNLCTNFALLMMLAFLLDQVQQLCDAVFQQALKVSKWKKYLWDDVRSYFRTLPFASMEMIYKAIIYGLKVEFMVIQQDSR